MSYIYRTQVEKDMGMCLSHYKNFIEEKILMTLGQMDEPSLIKDYLYLGEQLLLYLLLFWIPVSLFLLFRCCS